MPPINTIISTYYSKSLKRITRYNIKCANINCDNHFDVKASVWEKDSSRVYPRVFCCSVECSNSRYCLDLKSKIFETKHGYKNVFQSEEVKEKIKNTNLEKYGVENPWQSEEVKEKIKNTNLEKYGVEHPLKNQDIKNRVKKTREERYKNNLNGCCVKSKTYSTNLKRYGNIHYFASDSGVQNEQFYIKKYGPEKGPILWNDRKKKYAITLEKMIQKYGIEEGNTRYLNWKISCAQNLENFIKRYGEILGFEKWEKYKNERIKKLFQKGKNTKLNEYFEELLLEYIDISQVEREFNMENLWYDFKIKNNTLIEINGDYWHANPNKYNAEDIINYPGGRKIKACKIWEKDKNKINLAIKNGYKIFVFWESELKNKDKQKLIDGLKNIIEEKI